MKKLVIFLAVFLLMLPLQSVVEGHSGRTDSSGGHNCSQKSISKGLCTGYHYHNGGGSTSSNSSSSSTSNSNDKDCSDFATYDEVVQYWNSKGYSATYDPENLDGWGNGNVDDGIPCEAPTGYDKTQINNSAEQIQYNKEQQDIQIGNNQGYSQGKSDGYKEATANSSITEGSDAFKQGYANGYNNGYYEGKSKLESEKVKATNDGFALGQKQDEIVIPHEYISHESLKSTFEEAFNRAVTERIEVKKKEYSELGYKDGKNDLYSLPTNVDTVYVTAYEGGYDKGQKDLKEMYIQQGYEAAFTIVEYAEPDLDKEKYLEWYKEGFLSNTIVDEIEEIAFTQGEEGEVMSIPSNYEKGETIFTYYYELGFQDHEKQVKQTQQTVAGGLGVVVLAWLGRRFYVVRKMIA